MWQNQLNKEYWNVTAPIKEIPLEDDSVNQRAYWNISPIKQRFLECDSAN